MTDFIRWLIPTRPPLLSLVGVAVAFVGLGLDVLFHLTPAVHAHEHAVGFSLGEHSAHLIGLLGMLLALIGVMASGLRRHAHSTSH
ncbi:MAG TPA: hypothetical protein VFK61_04875 [Candidatus Limnocylindria bacterium]|nr:hypothetical protein [Candidatus Limnocylindria bacterium]